MLKIGQNNLVVMLVCVIAGVVGCSDEEKESPIYSCDFYGQVEKEYEEGRFNTQSCWEFSDTGYEAADSLTMKDESTSFTDGWLTTKKGECHQAGGKWSEEACVRDARAIGRCDIGKDDAEKDIEILAIILSYPILDPGFTPNKNDMKAYCTQLGGTNYRPGA